MSSICWGRMRSRGYGIVRLEEGVEMGWGRMSVVLDTDISVWAKQK